MGHRVQQRGATFLAAQSALRQVARRDQFRQGRAPRRANPIRRRDIAAELQFSGLQVEHRLVDQRDLLERIARIEADANSLAQRLAHAMTQEARRLSFDSSLRACCSRSK